MCAGKNFLGSTGLHLPNWKPPSFHIGYWLHKDAAGQGLGILRKNQRSPDGSLRDTIITARYDAEGLPPLEVTW